MRFQSTVRFGENFELDFQNYKLRRAGRVLKIERIPLDILFLLVERSPSVISREQIAEKVWGKNVFLDTDNSINGAIRKIRQVLRDDAEQPRFVQTVTGQGYRFIGVIAQEPQTEMPELEKKPHAKSEDEAQQAQPSIVPAPVRGWLISLTVAAALAACVGVSLFLLRGRPTVPRRAMVAVLPLQNLTGDARQDYFSDGLTEELIAQLGNIDPQHLRVIARTSVMRYKESPASIDQVGRELGAEYVIEGSVRRDGKDIRITAQLIQTKDQSHLWARQYDRELTGLLPLEGEVAQAIAGEIQSTLGEQKRTAAANVPLPRDYEAYDLFLKGQYFLNKRTAADFQQAITYFERSLAKDPNDSRAYASMADCYALLGAYSGQTQSEFLPKARAAALQALKIDDSSSDAHTALALIVQNYDWDWVSSEKEFRRAIELNPNNATAHHWYAEHLMWRGHFDEALQESERARQLDPLSLIIAADNGAIWYFSRRYDHAVEKWQSVLDMDPSFSRAHLIVGAYVEQGMFNKALADEKAWLGDLPASRLSWRAYIYARSGQTAKARRDLDALLKLNKDHPIDPMLIVRASVSLGEKVEALAWLEKACAEHSTEIVTLKVDPSFDPLRADPRFQDILGRVGLEK